MKSDYFCIDCLKKYPTGFMVTNAVWKEAGFTKYKDGVICLHCFQKRIIRKLVIEDFPDYPINSNIYFGFALCNDQ